MSFFSLQDNQSRLEQQVLAEQVALIFRGIPTTVIGNIVSGAMFVGLLWLTHDITEILIWYGVLLAVTAARGISGYRYHRLENRFSPKNSRRWGNIYLIGAIGSGLAWSGGALWFFTPDETLYQIAIAFTVVMMSAGSNTTNAIMKAPALSFIFITIAPYTVLLAFQGEQVQIVFTFIMLFAIVYLTKGALHFHDMTRDNIASRLDAETKGKELADSTAFQTSLISQMVDALVTMDKDGIVLSFNQAAEDIFGYRSEEIIGKSARCMVSKDREKSFTDLLRLFQATHDDAPRNHVFNLQGLDRNGYEFPIEISITRLWQKQKIIFSCLVRDVSEREQYERELLQAKIEAEKASRAKSEFLSSMSHELRTPLNAIIGFTELVEISLEDDTSKQYTKHILKASDHLLDLINQILDLSRIESGQLEVAIDTVNLQKVFSDVMSLMTPLAEAKNITLNTHLNEYDDYFVHADPVRLKQVLINLVSNAIKYNRDEGKVDIGITKQAEKLLSITVSDTGKGLNPQQQQRIFKPFDRAGIDGNSNIEGTGIGLTISRHLIKHMGGDIGVESTPDIGSNFWVTLPIANPVKKLEDTDRIRIMKLDQDDDASKRILYIEDNAANMKLVADILHEHTPHSFLSAENAETGLQHASNYKPDLILMDINLPGMNGFEAMEQLQATDDLKDIPVIAVSANASSQDIETGNKAGFKTYLTKPLRVASFLETVKNTLAEQNQPE